MIGTAESYKQMQYMHASRMGWIMVVLTVLDTAKVLVALTKVHLGELALQGLLSVLWWTTDRLAQKGRIDAQSIMNT